jgi:uncharacterized protein YjbI with pentapeptide repeats
VRSGARTSSTPIARRTTPDAARGASLRDLEAADATFTRCELDGADLSGADLGGAQLDYCSLSRSRLEGAAGTDLEHAELRVRTWSGSDLKRARCERSACTGCTFTTGSLAGVSFDGAILTDCIFSALDVAGADLSGATLEGTELEDLEHSDQARC